MMKNNNILAILAVVGGVSLIGAMVYVFGFTPARDIFTRGKADRALSLGRIEIATENDLKDYFVFLPAAEVKTLLTESKDKFLFPQVEFLFSDGKSLVVSEKDMNIQGSPMSFVTISGLASGAKIYPTTGGYGFVRGGIMPTEGNPLAWMIEFWSWIGADGSRIESPVMYFNILTYFPTSQAARDLAFNVNMQEGVFSHVREHLQLAQGAHLASLLTDNTLPEGLVSGGANIAMAVAGPGEGTFNRLNLTNILTQNGRIVMIQR